MQGEAARDKDYSFARLCDLKPNVTVKMYVYPIGSALTSVHSSKVVYLEAHTPAL